MLFIVSGKPLPPAKPRSNSLTIQILQTNLPSGENRAANHMSDKCQSHVKSVSEGIESSIQRLVEDDNQSSDECLRAVIANSSSALSDTK